MLSQLASPSARRRPSGSSRSCSDRINAPTQVSRTHRPAAAKMRLSTKIASSPIKCEFVREMLASESALLAVAQADTDAEGHSAALSRFMVRSESAASSKIERINATARDYAKAIAGNKGNSSATSMVAASRALHELVARVGEAGRFELARLRRAPTSRCDQERGRPPRQRTPRTARRLLRRPRLVPARRTGAADPPVRTVRPRRRHCLPRHHRQAQGHARRVAQRSSRAPARSPRRSSTLSTTTRSCRCTRSTSSPRTPPAARRTASSTRSLTPASSKRSPDERRTESGRLPTCSPTRRPRPPHPGRHEGGAVVPTTPLSYSANARGPVAISWRQLKSIQEERNPLNLID